MPTIDDRLTGQLMCLLLFAAQVAGAQDLGNDRARSFHAETGAFFSHIPPADSAGVGLRAAIGTSQRVAFEAGFDWMDGGRREHLPDQIVWLYFLQARQQLAESDDSRSTLFATYGTAGWIERNGTITGLRASLVPPLAPLVGIGAQRSLWSHTAIRGDVHLLWMFGDDVPLATVRVSGGLSLLIGH